MNILINQKQYKLLFETTSSVNLAELEGIVNKSNSFQKEYGVDYYSGDYNEDRSKAVKDFEKYSGISVEKILDEYQSYLNSKNKLITNMIVSQSSPVNLVREMVQKMISLIMNAYNNIGSMRKWGGKKLINNLVDDKSELKERIYWEGLNFIEYYLSAIFRRMGNWIPDVKSVDEKTKKIYSKWCTNTSLLFDDDYISPYWKKVSDKVISDLFS
jgi:hypothetical protein